ncbi:MAG: M16 family metallopeptidase [Vulcanimicrobiota bacterium]
MKRKIVMFLALLLMALSINMPVSAGENYLPEVNIRKLDNGLTVMVVEDHSSPTVACYRYHKVGSINEWPGVTGAAHLLEHMMFKGTKKIGTWNYEAEVPIMNKIDSLVEQINVELAKGLTDYQKMDEEKVKSLWAQIRELQTEQKKYIRKNEIDYIYKSLGGRGLNASTSFDRTDYYILLPSNKVEVWGMIESDRMRSPVFREFYSERDVVKEESRMYNNTPYGQIFRTIIENMYVTLPYGHEIIGWMSDLNTIQRKEIEEFFRKFYAPNNTVLVLVGDITKDEGFELVAKHFSDIPSQPAPDPVFSQEPLQKGERRVEVNFDSNPIMAIGFHGPRPGNPDQYAMEILGEILSSGRTSRLHKNLIETNIAFVADAGQWTLAYVNPFIFWVAPKKPYTMDQLEEALYKEIDKLKTEPVTDEELQRAKNKLAFSYYSKVKSPMYLAEELARAHVWTGNWKNMDERAHYDKVTADDVMRVANKYLVKSNRTVVRLKSEEKSETAVK